METMWLLILACSSPEAVCENGLDLDQDGVCDHDRADWSENALLPSEGDRHNIYQLSAEDLEEVTNNGLNMAAVWPVTVSGLLMPAASFQTLFEDNTSDPQRKGLQSLARTSMGFGTLSEMYAWIGLPDYPDDGSVPIPEGMSPGDPMGVGVLDTPQGEALSFSCYACHATNFYGHVVVGLTNRRARANEYFYLASQFFPLLEASLYQEATGASDAEIEMFQRAQQNLPAVGAKVPMVHGLDTSLAQVALSLARREDDPWASRNPALEENPRPNPLSEEVADSKPAVWWTLRYKTRWLSDGSIRSGNPIFTNFLWNELGRGTELHALQGWMDQNGSAIDALTVAVFNTPSPRWETIFPQFPIDVEAAKAGEVVYQENCSSCHGSYTKGWSEGLTGDEGIQTVHLEYSSQTEVVDVGTDPQRAEGMNAFADGLNRLQISQSMGTTVRPQLGYVPPPLDAVWSRFPYLHNGSIPSLCALVDSSSRPSTFYVGPPDDPSTDFDPSCVGLPVTPPESWTADPKNRMDTSIPGLGNGGHDQMMLPLSSDQRAHLIEFLKTL